MVNAYGVIVIQIRRYFLADYLCGAQSHTGSGSAIAAAIRYRHAKRSSYVAEYTVPLPGREKEGLIVTVVQLGDNHRAANGEIGYVLNPARRPGQPAGLVKMVQRFKRAPGVDPGGGTVVN